MNANPVVGVISGASAYRAWAAIGSRADRSHDLPFALSGMIYARLSTGCGTVQPGDLLVPSSDPGVEMRAGNHASSVGRVFGKALEHCSCTGGEALVLMLLMNRQPMNAHATR